MVCETSNDTSARVDLFNFVLGAFDVEEFEVLLLAFQYLGGLTSRPLDLVPCLRAVNSIGGPKPSSRVRTLRMLHSAIGMCELGCLAHLWVCVLTRRRDRWLKVASSVLIGEGIALVVAKGCPLGIVQRRAGDDVSMFEYWFGPRRASMAIPTLTVSTFAGFVLLRIRPPTDG